MFQKYFDTFNLNLKVSFENNLNVPEHRSTGVSGCFNKTVDLYFLHSFRSLSNDTNKLRLKRQNPTEQGRRKQYETDEKVYHTNANIFIFANSIIIIIIKLNYIYLIHLNIIYKDLLSLYN